MISKKCKYALKALLYISKNSGEKAILTSSIARDENIPRKFLESILRNLRNNQILHSKRGKEGGFLLLRDPKEIYIVEIMRIMDGPVAMLPCVSLNYYQSCEECDEKSCAIKGIFENIRDKTLEVLGGTSLHDLNQQ
ncbi:MAG: Rrf2 family transcriptional regulator [Flavobacteriaceae bacterium]|nr:Rrf2 family transcriptional regulator [Flavobacteriaceae bacterium]NCF30302.1 Rrf2 family transcriptional regulator [Bacteroidota bacterium]